MSKTVADLQIGEKGIIEHVCLNDIPLKLLEMGCMPGKEVEMVQIAPFNDPLYIIVNGSHIAIRKEVATIIKIETDKILCDIIKSK